MPTIELEAVTKVWGESVAIDRVSLSAPEGEFVVLLGPSGCGKSTTLRIIAGLETVTEGTVRIGGRDVTNLSPSERQISMVFQSYALFPHLDVAENILFGLKVRKVPAAEREARLAKVVELVGLGGLGHRKPAQLSGGQRQRVALARAIIAENQICLMDEPLSNLDAKLRNEMRVELRALQRRLAMTVVYVTHDQTEAMSMADRVILMRDGRIEQVGTPDDLYRRPRTTFAAQFIGTPPMNLIAPAESPPDAHDALDHPLLAGVRQGLICGVRPEDVRIAEQGVPASVVTCDYLGADSIVNAQIAGQAVSARLPGRALLAEGDTIRLDWAPEALHLFDAASGERRPGLAE